MGDLIQFDPLALVILLIAGGGVLVVARMFIQAGTIREREMWIAIQTMMKDVKEINQAWLETYKAQGDKSSDTTQILSGNIATLTTRIEQLTAAVDKSIESGSDIKGASKLMLEYLKGGNGREEVRHEKK